MAIAIKNKKRLMFIKIDDDNEHRGQGATATPGLRPLTAVPDLGIKDLAFFSHFIW